MKIDNTQIKSKISQKVLPKNKTLPWLIFALVANGYVRQSHIADKLNIYKQKVNYWVRKLSEDGYLEKDKVVILGRTYKQLRLTQPGQNLLDVYESQSKSRRIRLENVRFKATIIRMPEVQVDWNKVPMRNWSQYISKVGDITVRLNEGKNPSLEFIPQPVEGDSPYELYYMAQYDCESVARLLEQRLKMQLGRLEPSSKPEWAMYDPVAKEFSKHNGQLRLDIGKINASPPRHVGEIEFFNPKDVSDYLVMPSRVSDLSVKSEEQTKMLETLLNTQIQNLQTTNFILTELRNLSELLGSKKPIGGFNA